MRCWMRFQAAAASSLLSAPVSAGRLASEPAHMCMVRWRRLADHKPVHCLALRDCRQQAAQVQKRQPLRDTLSSAHLQQMQAQKR